MCYISIQQYQSNTDRIDMHLPTNLSYDTYYTYRYMHVYYMICFALADGRGACDGVCVGVGHTAPA